MRQREHDAGFVGTGINFKRFGNADETRVVVVAVCDAVRKLGQAVQRRAGFVADRGCVGSLAFRKHFGRIGALGDLDILAQ